MYLIEPTGWLAGAKRCPSPNYNQRPSGDDISLLLIHNISLPAAEFGGPYVHQLFTNCIDCDAHASFQDLRGLTVSAHLFINRKGIIHQFVSFNDRAWHAGVSQFEGRDNCNDYSIGIELEGADDINYTDAQYRELITVTKSLQSYYPAITTNRIVGHSDVAPGRKTDPGIAFDWRYYKTALG
ncbi:1,6-anhydro-N-acetylmuramyl-L-alanine amidase AmpD [Zhongshania aliphaticivorans]|uniref:1,6-anhydro-N-acetylmuramyl-L-alanine amidase AmpD n=1 Tax=Zhongshania aliphaticivorans TaxID=1470434 RepID=A0A5S9N4R6_9GAMM|nr:1,6-anhydro-N-acetylmuramyl-L-alanine amidase AmpD [Zhongshania aliphaticivorans]CAA0082932.1 1,6-anhydro-N-acetylmuramyl-L-alanine amidase AmpD [Zhongshania aliphaticivorans]CAA0083862.1 1,6-anhydro-N-acetylmuramyl-L-alanine amidase AmpD [Zhongshania aliphaticivorans]